MDQWNFVHDGFDLIITGPGNLEIRLPRFSPLCAVDCETMPGRVAWQYYLCGNLWLRYIGGPCYGADTDEVHELAIGPFVRWRIPAEFAERLCNLMGVHDHATT